MSRSSKIAVERIERAKQKGLELSQKEEWALRYFHRLPLPQEAEQQISKMSSLDSFKLLQSAFDKLEAIEGEPGP